MKLLGDKEVTQKLQSIAEDLATDILRRGAQSGAEVYKLAMEQLAPRSDEAPHMADNIAINEVESFAPGTITKAIGPTTDFDYARHQEFGTRRHAAQPFMRPTFDVETDEALDDAAQVVRNAIEDLG
jgi:HK97 gp10 family phage protein